MKSAPYLSGALLLFVLIFLYRWTTDKLARHRAKKQQEQSAYA